MKDMTEGRSGRTGGPPRGRNAHRSAAGGGERERAGSGRMSASRACVAVLGLLGGIAGILHGLAEIRKGNVGTEGLMLGSVGAFTQIPNYLATGVAAVVVGMGVIQGGDHLSSLPGTPVVLPRGRPSVCPFWHPHWHPQNDETDRGGMRPGGTAYAYGSALG